MDDDARALVEAIVSRYSQFPEWGTLGILDRIPKEERRYKCFTCLYIVDESPCPRCKETHLVQMCPLDHCHCTHEVIMGIEYCPMCGQAICPDCGSHDVTQISRVTGYLQDVAGWNAGKQQELKDRTRYDAEKGTAVSKT